MRVHKVTVKNFRNYQHAAVDLSAGRNILIGENAQGKTNFLEAIEIASRGKSSRAQSELDLIRQGESAMLVEVQFEARGVSETVGLSLRSGNTTCTRSLEKQYHVNGLTQSTARSVKGRLVTVGFKSEDLYLLRGGPKYRRDWIDSILSTLRPTFDKAASKYQKVVTQRNRLLKTLFEKGRLTVTDQDELKVWDTQLAQLGAWIIKQRLQLLARLLPEAEKFQEHISGKRERLTATYTFTIEESEEQDESEDDGQSIAIVSGAAVEASEEAIASALLRRLRQRRAEEIARKQTLAGPHRDDINFCLNATSAVDFASQGQQRSLVLSLKLAELEEVRALLDEPPVLLLDDVLAELDLLRQGLLMSLINEDMQTIITTTHLDGFQPAWLHGALILKVSDGAVATDGNAALSGVKITA